MDFEREFEELGQAGRHVALARRCASRQVEIVEQLRSHGLDTTVADRLLATCRTR